jgi:hypothetical protein
MEPETPYRHISNVTFREVTFQGNGMTQVVLNLGAQGNNTDNITLDSCLIQNSSASPDAGQSRRFPLNWCSKSLFFGCSRALVRS